MRNLYDNLPKSLPEELVTVLLESEHVRVERILSTGHASPAGFWYDQDEDEWVLLLTGAARLRFEGREAEIPLGVGDYLLIPAHTRHRVEWTTPAEPTVWLAVFLDTRHPPGMV
ncbi:MAG: cupin domain-containing protein [Planctomycetaceae bacterium]|nr:cupin domain-containing protein [Planctomycetaceae bacterium]